ncbi:HD-GYP domain-containing protein [Tepidicella xavieri]|jgi:HD-GYP domain-containing protein (c-di-GMP phosphodiesterase class II)|uniref:HD domain-containing protein n=1 Tax=Tepidicella xavieri TaxID=360241 RepID=A0A4R6U5Q0_9BURK|nr:HD domain-containing phosphohydrolase [Tepidicella xavieri]TDQ41810.1 HD domain-containing protein [Tepidicella xavieri]
MSREPADAPAHGLPPDLEAVLKDVQTQLDPDPTEGIPALRRRLAQLLLEGRDARDFSRRLAFIEAGLRTILRAREDDTLFVLVQMLSDRQYGYCATHALMAATTCLLVAPLAEIAEPQLSSLVRAALTMNMAMAELQDVLAQQAPQATPYQREQIEAHPTESANMLRALGIDDPLWLELVQDHHEAPDGSGYPHHKTALTVAQQLLRMSDLFIARISPRASRRGLWPNVVVGNLYLESQTRASPLGAYFVRQLGMYPPGSYVRLKTNEVAVIVRRGARVNTPLAMAITDPDGLLLSAPGKRDTQLPIYAIQSPVSPEDVRIRLDKARLLRRV